MYIRRKRGAQGAHEAIRPTSLKFQPETIEKELSKEQYRLYSMIWKRFLSSQAKRAIYNTKKAIIISGKHRFEASSAKLDFPGFLLIAGIKEKEIEEIPVMEKGELLSFVSADKKQEFTKPKPRYTEGAMVKELEARGIGRPSTYAPIINTLLQRQYIEKKEGKLIPTELGEMVEKVLIENFPKLFDVKFTSGMEEELDKVETRKKKREELLSEFYKEFSKLVGSFDIKEAKKSLEEETDEVCEKCGKPMIIKVGRYGKFLACSGYPECKNTRPLPQEVEETEKVCPVCGAKLVIKKSRYGRFVACSGYPECKHTEPLGIGIKCPLCGAEMVERQTKRGKTFYGCSNYPKCNFSMWDHPVERTCPKCKNKVMGKRGKFLVCPSCKERVLDKTQEEVV